MRGFILGILTILIILSVTTFVIDPYQYYRKATSYEPVYLPSSERAMIPGLIKNYDYDSAIVGNSMSENFLTPLLKSTMNWNTIKLTMEGATSYELSLIYERLFRENKVKNVITTLDFFTYDKEKLQSGYDMPQYLYNNWHIDDIRYLLNIGALKQELDNINKYKGTRYTDINYAYFWGDLVTYSKDQVIKQFFESIDKKDIENKSEFNTKQYNTIINNFNNHLYKYLKNNSEVTFTIIFPPYSVLYWKQLQVLGDLEEYEEAKQYTMNKLLELKNVNIYDFQQDKNIIYELKNYRDIAHYSHEISSFMLYSIKQGNYKVTKESSINSLALLKNIIQEYDISELKKSYVEK